MTPERQAEIKTHIANIAKTRQVFASADSKLEQERELLAREYVIGHLLGTTEWSVEDDSLVAHQSLGIEVLKLFGAQFYHESFPLTGPLHDARTIGASDMLSWLQDEGHLCIENLPGLLDAFRLSTDYPRSVSLDDHYTVVARVDDSTLRLQCANTETLLAFVEEHKLVVRWDYAEKAIQEADAAVVEATARAARIRTRMSRFLRPKE